jgi:energy-converting hydrogenase Eha subunit A
MVHALRRTGMLWPLAVAFIAPAIVAGSAAILLALLGVFVVWLCIVAALVTAIVFEDFARRSVRRLAPAPVRGLERPAAGTLGR